MGPLAGAAISLGSNLLANSIFGKKQKKPNIDYAGMTKTVNQGADTESGMVDNAYAALQPLGKKYADDMGSIGDTYLKSVNDLGTGYQKDLNSVGASDIEAANKAGKLNAARTYSSIPLAQQLIRQNLASSGNLRSGAAAKALSAPVNAAQTDVSQYNQALDVNNLNKVSARQEKGIDAVYNSKIGAAFTKLGLDRETLTPLLANGRTDIISRAAQLIGIDNQKVTNLLGIGGIQAKAELASVAGENQQNQDLLGSIFKIIGNYQAQASTAK